MPIKFIERATTPVIAAATVAGLLLGAAMPAAAVPIEYVANLSALNGSGVSATYNLSLDGTMLTVTAQAFGLEAGLPHPQHIHGLIGPDAPLTSTPTLEQDTDGDKFIELAEGLVKYGPIILSLTSPPGGAVADFPTAPGGSFMFSQTYDLTNSSIFENGFGIGDLLPLENREIVLHGLTVPAGIGAGTPGEVNGSGGYLAVLPVAAGQIELAASATVAEPMSLALLAVAAAGLGVIRRRRAA